MTLNTLREMLLWCAVINYGLLLGWFLLFTAAHDWLPCERKEALKWTRSYCSGFWR